MSTLAWRATDIEERKEQHQALGKVSHTDKKHPMVVVGVQGICLLASLQKT